MSASLSPHHFAVPSTTNAVMLTISGMNINLEGWNFNGPATFKPADSPTTHTWQVSSWMVVSPVEALFTLTVPSSGTDDPIGGSSGTLTVTGTNGSNTQPIPVPCSTS